MPNNAVNVKDKKMKKSKGDMKYLFRIISYAIKVNKGLFIGVAIFIFFQGICNLISPVFIQRFIDSIISPNIKPELGFVNQMTDAIFKDIIINASIMGGIYFVGVLSLWIAKYMNNKLIQDAMHQLRVDLFTHMERLPLSYFDTHHHGDIMSVYTNDTDTFRMVMAEAIPSVYISLINLIGCFVIMLIYSLYLTVLVVAFLVIIALISKYVTMTSSRAFTKLQKTIGDIEGYIEEMMAGQKVVKVFNREDKSLEGFDHYNEEFYKLSTKGNIFSNVLMPVIGNMGNLLFIIIAIVGSAIVLTNPSANVTITGFVALTPGTVVSFMTLGRMSTNQISQTSSQVGSIVMGVAGGKRIFALLDEEEEVDNGNVTLVNVTEDENGNLVEVEQRTGRWAWKQPANDKYPLTYRELKGDIRMFDVDFGYVKDKIVLHDISLYAKPGQKIAFVGATGAGKTTITNLINRFYDIADGKIRYDDININTIKKADLRRSLGIIIQDTALFSGTIMDNIRYGKLDATDEECIEAAKLANAHDFIMMMPEGYNTRITGEGGSLSQGQKQLISIARAACCNAPVMIMDEATSSIDTRTEYLVQEGMDKLMFGRTVFVIAHRLSTVKNSNAIMVLDHGRIIERGSHQELIEQKGTYYQLYTGAFELE